jgi:hypothetical protein
MPESNVYRRLQIVWTPAPALNIFYSGFAGVTTSKEVDFKIPPPPLTKGETVGSKRVDFVVGQDDAARHNPLFMNASIIVVQERIAGQYILQGGRFLEVLRGIENRRVDLTFLDMAQL